MKRALVSLASVAVLLGFAAPAFASPNYATRHNQPRVDRRAAERAAVNSWTLRTQRQFVRAEYNNLVQRVMPSILAVTGNNGYSSDLDANHGPTARYLLNVTLERKLLNNHCTEESNDCGMARQ